MKIPSIYYLFQTAGKSFVRFPFTVLSSLVSVCTGIYLFEQRDSILNMFPYINVILCAALGISLFFCVDVYAEKKSYGNQSKFIFRVLALIILVALYFTFPGYDSTQNTSLPYIRYAIYSIIIHLLVAFIPFIGVGQLNGFWHYNRILFVRFLTSLLYSGFLYGGLALALGSLDFLFDVDLHEELFFDLFILIGGFFNTWFFVSGIPHEFDSLEQIDDYPKGIKVFSQYVLLPLLILYLFILYGYAGKIVVLWSWPKGVVSYLVACVAVLGILTLLLIYPYGSVKGNGWIKSFSRIYYMILYPLIALLFIAIGMRVADYGVTINRYVIVLLGVWLTIVCVYFTVGKTNIKFIPISLTIILILVSFGYWGMFSLSERSQVNRLKKILEENNILSSQGKIQHEATWAADSINSYLHILHNEASNDALLNDSLHNEVRSIVGYLDNYHGYAAIRDWFSYDIDSMIKAVSYYKKYGADETDVYLRSMGLKNEYRYASASVSNYYNFYAERFNTKKIIEITGYDYMIESDYYNYNKIEMDSIQIGSLKCLIHYALNQNIIFVYENSDTVAIDLNPMFKKLLSNYRNNNQQTVPDDELAVFSEGHLMDIKWQVRNLNFDVDKDSIRINSLQSAVFIDIKD